MGDIQVRTRLVQGSETLRLLLTDKRIIVDHLGKRGITGTAGFSILGALGSALVDLLKCGRETAAKRSMKILSPDQLLKAHRDNFTITYPEIVSVTIVHVREAQTTITILTADEKYEFSTPRKFDIVAGLLKGVLVNKVTIRSY